MVSTKYTVCVTVVKILIAWSNCMLFLFGTLYTPLLTTPESPVGSVNNDGCKIPLLILSAWNTNAYTNVMNVTHCRCHTNNDLPLLNGTTVTLSWSYQGQYILLTV